MGASFYIDAEIADVQKALEGTPKAIDKITKQVLGLYGKEGLKTVKAEIKAVKSPKNAKWQKYYTHSGEYLKSWKSTVKKDLSQVAVFPGQTNKTFWAWGITAILNYGTKDGRIKPRGFVQRAENKIINLNGSGEMATKLNVLIDKELTKYWG